MYMYTCMMYCLSVSLSGAGESGKSTIVKQMKYDKAIDIMLSCIYHVHVHVYTMYMYTMYILHVNMYTMYTFYMF